MEPVNPNNLSLEEKCMDKSWETRLKSYEAVTKLFHKIENRKSPEFHKFIGLIKSFITDNHPTAQEKGLEAALAYIENCAHANRIACDVMNGIVTKCITARRVKTKELAMQITHKYVQLGKQEVVQEELLSGMEQKKNQPKTISACINTFTILLQKFGADTINIEPLLQRMGPLLSDRDKMVRDDTKFMIVELYKCIGRDALERELKKADIQAIQRNELEEEFERIETVKIVLQTKEVECVEKTPVKSNETFMLPKDFYKKIKAKKWQERKEALENIEHILTAPLQSANYSDLIRALTAVIEKDSNVICVALAAKCLVLLASGLKHKFQNYSSFCIPVLLEKFREKKQHVVTAIREALDSIYSTTTLESMLENIAQALNSNSPSVKTETQHFLRRIYKTSPSTIIDKKVLAVITSALIKNLNDSDSSVRETSAETLGSLMNVVGESTMTALLEGVDSLKLLKIKEYSSRTISNGVSSKKVKESKTHKTDVCMNEERELSDEEINITEIFSTDTVKSIACNDWKSRLQAAQQMLAVIQTKSTNVPTRAIVKFLIGKPGLKDTNFQVVKAKLCILKHLAEHCKFTTTTANCCVADICERFTDGKNINELNETLDAIAKATSLTEVAKTVVNSAFNQKSPKIQQESLIWLSEALKKFGFEGLNIDFLVDASKRGISCSNSAVRQAAITLLGVVYSRVGSSLFELIEGTIKNSVLELIKAECEKYNGEGPSVCTRSEKEIGKTVKPDIPIVQIKPEKAMAIIEAPPVIIDNEEDEDTSPLFKINSAKEQRNSKWHFDHPTEDAIKLLKREMMAAEFNKTLMKNMFHSDPKHRLKALESLTGNYSNEAMVYNLDLILKWITLRLFDADTKILQTGLLFVRTLLMKFEVESYTMSNYEIDVFTPHLIHRLDSSVGREIKEILQRSRLQHKQMFNHFIEGLESKSVLQKCDCLDLLAHLFEKKDITISDGCLGKIAQCMADDEDEKVQTSALNCMSKAFNVVGNKIYDFLPESNKFLQEFSLHTSTKTTVISSKDLKKTSPKLLKENEHTIIPSEVNQKHSEKLRANLHLQFMEDLNVFRKPDLSHCNLSSIAQQTLLDIFEKLHSEEREIALKLLFDFIQRHPRVDIQPFWDASSKWVLEYAPDRLRDLEEWLLIRQTIEKVKERFQSISAV